MSASVMDHLHLSWICYIYICECGERMRECGLKKDSIIIQR